MMTGELDEKTRLLNRAGAVLNSILKGLDAVELETRKRIMELCGEACAGSDRDLDIAKKIAEEASTEEEIVARVNEELPWCGTWIMEGNTIHSSCVKCGCPLVRNQVIDLTGTLCYCSRGWVKQIFEIALRKPVRVELERAIGLGDETCKFVIYT